MTKINKEKTIKKVRKEIDVIGAKLKVLKEEAIYDRGYTDGWLARKDKNNITIVIVVFALLTVLAIYKSL